MEFLPEFVPHQVFTWVLGAFGELEEEQDMSLAGQMRIWEQDELREIQEEHERFSGPAEVQVGGGAGRHSNLN
jgi:hypothetical protein